MWGRVWDGKQNVDTSLSLFKSSKKCWDVSEMGRGMLGRRWDLGRGSAKCRDVSWMKKLLGQRKERA